MIIVGNLSSKRFPSHRLRNARAIIGPHQQFHSVNKREGSPKNVIATRPCVIPIGEVKTGKQKFIRMSELLTFLQWKWMGTKRCTGSKRTTNMYYMSSLDDMCTIFQVFWSHNEALVWGLNKLKSVRKILVTIHFH